MKGRPLEVPDEGPKRLRSIRITDVVWEDVQDRAEQCETTASKWVESAVRMELRREKAKDARRGKR